MVTEEGARRSTARARMTSHWSARTLLAAMEPAVERREHPVLVRITVGSSTPQWSPPMNGESTIDTRIKAVLDTEPQWSPPSNGGSTHRRGQDHSAGVAAAMEPAAERWEHCGGRARGVPGPSAAMEPAGEQWEHDKAIRGSMTDLF